MPRTHQSSTKKICYTVVLISTLSLTPSSSSYALFHAQVGSRRQLCPSIIQQHQPVFDSLSVAISMTMDRHNPSQSSSSDDSECLTDYITILGFGSLLSIKSAHLTFPKLKNFRLGRVPNHRRVFGHPASIFFERDIAILDTLEMSSLSCEYDEGHSFVCSVFEVPNVGLSTMSIDGEGEDEKPTNSYWIPSRAFLEREEEFEIALVPYKELTSANDIGLSSKDATAPLIGTDGCTKKGVICRRSTDDAYIALWGKEHFENKFLKYGVETIWDWPKDSGLRPCPVYLRHCVLASYNCESDGHEQWSRGCAGGVCYNSFLDETYLVDRETTVREYLNQYPEIMNLEPPDSLRERYGG